ncbi:YheC/YheD family endospore coat-associated protein [Bacillus sp. KH172YL63]|uniref:YheC/YheD family endospore coat-associated protein n=1 Tax=Bacillus sp. KH172YL63 TaxID=2709784 RepID=UPI0013E4C729|nr:YheC/YheD family protein [Bacillus sp. KH172YL63]BCB02909.1 endospore coat-associated protein YheC [Bacillus sp. KH172YL63]
MNHSLGIMTLTPQETNPYFLEIAKHSLSHMVDLYLFSPKGISPIDETVEGYHFNRLSQKWVEEVFNIPDYIYDRTYYQNDMESRQAKAIVQWLKNQKHIRFLGYGLPNKWHLYEKLRHTSLSPYIPETFLAADGYHLMNLLDEHQDIIIKPVDGAQGYAVYHITSVTGGILLRTTKKQGIMERTFPSKDMFLRWVGRILQRHTFICQKRLPNLTKSGAPFDMRILLNKDQSGEWREFQRAVRLGEENAILTNISRGAAYHSFSDWKKADHRRDWAFIEGEITGILDDMPVLLEDHFSPLFEIGVDLIIGEDQSLWILDMNSKPGHKLVGAIEPEKLSALYNAPLDYCDYLSSLSLTSLNRGDF